MDRSVPAEKIREDSVNMLAHHHMTDKWFDEYNFEVVVDKKYLPKRILEIFNQEPVALDPWDPMGSLANKTFSF